MDLNLDNFNFTKKEPITKGLSGDIKYQAETADGRKFLLRESDISQYENKKQKFDLMKQWDALGVPMCRPVDFGVCNDGKSVYQILTWCDGKDLETAMTSLSEADRYALGVRGGEILKKIHSISAPPNIDDWYNRYIGVIDERVQAFIDCGVRFDGWEMIIDYYKSNRALLHDRPQAYLHGDYHAGNLMLSDDGELFVIDWEPIDFNGYGDPWTEITMQECPHFSTGLINGYFGGNVPEEFWKLHAFYSSVGAVTSIPWAYYRFQDELKSRVELCTSILRWYNNMQNPVPAWYFEGYYIQYIDGLPYKLKSPFNFSFISNYGTVFKVFDDQDSGNICFGVQNVDDRYFIKFAGAPTEQYTGTIESAIRRLKAAVSAYRDLAHPNLIKFIKAEEIGGGFAVIFEWVDAVCAHPMYPADFRKFKQVPLDSRKQIFEDILDFHINVAANGYTAVDFYRGSIMWDFNNQCTVICDIDFYTKDKAYGSTFLWGHMDCMSPEERTDGVLIDEISNVYAMGATAFALFADSDRSLEKWPLSEKLYAVATRAVNDDRSKRQQSIRQLMDEWKAEREELQ